MPLERGQRGLGRIAGSERLVLDRGRMRGEGRRDLVGPGSDHAYDPRRLQPCDTVQDMAQHRLAGHLVQDFR
jgi:hypothetical protein